MRNYGKRRETAPSSKKKDFAEQSHPELLTPHSSLLTHKYTIGFDLGSNTLRAVKYDCTSREFVAEYEKIVRTAEGLVESGRISEAAIGRVIEAVHEARERLGCDDAKIRAVATEAMRRAANREEVLQRIEDETGIRFEVIDGEEEARLTLLAVRERLKRLGIDAESFVMVDIGGGSTELVFNYREEIVSRSFPLGIVTLSQEAGGWRNVPAALEKHLPTLKGFIGDVYAHQGKPRLFSATAGTPTTVAALKLGMDYESYDSARINGTRLCRQDLEKTLQMLLAMNPEERQKAVGVGRDDLIAAGILIFDALFDLLGFEECIVIDDGLREGVAVSLCEDETARD
ncbi:phosphatase [Nitratifractor salsuginis]|uniref:Ppx/GppA phosphatase n=1 Tax=Nitratifractor salsuginis (strain DSM 16511 / JCM 12458 / E9I37-1) TaxID=749222 RepID=E6X0M5_NITSE|nr:phosphatase [Nitratifractor salsuginis]ADV45745.1 Ppx/GppA phosphatase [Nitratifractor salsuginis DSM 16511]